MRTAVDLFHPGKNCHAVVRAERAAILVDAERYYAVLFDVFRRARRSIAIVGWDIDSRMRLLVGEAAEQAQAPTRLGELFGQLLSTNSELEITILGWDYPFFYIPERESSPFTELERQYPGRLRLHLDDALPVPACHHQKIVVVDGVLAFSGGLDLTQRRWDTRAHRAGDERRIQTSGQPYAPFHDIQAVVDGKAARALAKLVCERWEQTGQEAPNLVRQHSDGGEGFWPEGLAPDFEDIDVAISLTRAPYRQRAGLRQVERLYLDLITAARHLLYIENQYLTADGVVAQICERVRGEIGPEVVVILPQRCDGMLEEATMGVLRAQVLQRLADSDPSGRRLFVGFPHIEGLGDSRLVVHAKLMIVDDRWLRVGSANLSNRSMGLDTECDLTFAAETEAHRKAVERIRTALLAEHAGCAPDAWTRRVKMADGSVVDAIRSRREEARSEGAPRWLAPLGKESSLLIPDAPIRLLADADEPMDPDALLQQLWVEFAEGGESAARSPGGERNATNTGAAKFVLPAMLALPLVLAALWAWSPLGEAIDARNVAGWILQYTEGPGVVALVLAAFLVGGFVAFPVTVLIAVAGMLFGPVEGFAYSTLGTWLSAMSTYTLGRWFGKPWVRRIAGKRINQIARSLSRGGIVPVAVVRMVPVAPFTVVNLVAGAGRVGFREFAVGTLLGMIPGTVAITVFSDQFGDAVTNPSAENLLYLAALAVGVGAVLYAVKRWARSRAP